MVSQVTNVGTVLRFPTSRRRPYKTARLDLRNLPVNVQVLRDSVGKRVLPPANPLPPTGYAILAIIAALRTDPKKWERTGGPDVFGQLTRMLGQWEGDPEIRAQVRLAIELVCARNGRWHLN